MGVVLSLPCFLRRRRHCATSHPPRNVATVATVKISHPRPLGSGLGTSVHGGGGSGMSAVGGGSGRSIRSTIRYGDRATIRGIERSRSASGITGASLFEEGGTTAASSPGKAYLDILPESDAEETQETHESFGSGIKMSPIVIRARAGSSSSGPGAAATASSCGAQLRRSQLPASPPRAFASISGESLSRRDGTSASTTRRTVPKRTDLHQHAFQSLRDQSFVSHSRPMSYPYDTEMFRSDSTRTFPDTHKDASGDPGWGSDYWSLSPDRRRKLRKIKRVDNGWDYIRPTDLDGWRDGLGRNGRRTSFAE